MYMIHLLHSNNRHDYTISYQGGDYSLDKKGSFIRVRVVAHSRSVQLSTAVTFRCGSVSSIKPVTRRRTGDCTSS